MVAELITNVTEAKGQTPMPVKRPEITRTYGNISLAHILLKYHIVVGISIRKLSRVKI